jgi:YVTN family beta-propeller protein
MADNLTEALENTVLTLYPPRLPKATVPVVGADLGVPLRIYDDAPMGATVEVDPYLGQRQGDTVTLNLNGQPGIDSEQTASDSSTTTLYIPHKLLLPDITNRLTYSVTRNSQNAGTSKPPLELLYNAIRPGNRDTNDGEDGHSRLDLLLPDAIKHGVGPDFPVAGAQVCVSYPYCRAFDVIRLNCNGHEVVHTVTELQAPKPGSDEPVTVCFTLTRAELEKAKDHPQFKFSYTVTDQLTNSPVPIWSATQIVDVDLTGSRLPMPILREIQNDPTDEPGIIDLEKLGKNPLLLIVLTNDPRFKPGDTLNATYTAKVTGQPDVVVTVSGIVEADEFGQNKPCVLQVANAQVITGSEVTATYQLLRNGTVQGSSRVASARVIGEGLPDLKPPRLQKSVNGLLDPLDAANLQGANGQAEVLGYRKGDTVQLIVEGAPGAGSPTFTPRPLNANSRANFPLDKAFIAANMGKQVKLSYLLIRNGKPPPPPSSPVLTASVGTIPDGHPSLPTPAIDGAVGNMLDVSKLAGTENLRVERWPFQEARQPVWLRCEGVNQDGDKTSKMIRQGEPNNSADGLIILAPLEWLGGLMDDSDLKIEFKISFDGNTNEEQAVTTPIRSYKITAITKLELSFINAPYTVAPGGRLKDINLLLRSAAGTPVPNATITLTLPAGFTYSDGGNGARDFTSGTEGVVIVSGVKGTATPGPYTLRAASSGASEATAVLTVMERGPVGSIVGLASPYFVAISPDGARAYVTSHSNSSVSVIETVNNSVIQTISLGLSTLGVAVHPDSSRVYVTKVNDNSVWVIDTATTPNKEIQRITIGHGAYGVAVHPNGSRAYVTHYNGNSVSVIDTATTPNSVIQTIPLGRSSMWVAVHPDGSRVYVTNYYESSVSVIDTATTSVIKTITVGVSSWGAWVVAVHPDGSRAYVTNRADHSVSVIDTATNSEIHTIMVGRSPHGVAVHPDGSRVYVTNIQDSSVSVINTASNTVIETIPVGRAANGVAVHTDSRVYVTNRDGNSVSVFLSN